MDVVFSLTPFNLHMFYIFLFDWFYPNWRVQTADVAFWVPECGGDFHSDFLPCRSKCSYVGSRYYLASAENHRALFLSLTHLRKLTYSLSSTLKKMSAPHSLRLASNTDRSSVLDDRSYPEVIRSDQDLEVSREHAILEVVRDYPEPNHNIPSALGDNQSSEQPKSRTGDYRILGVRWWVLVVLVCVVVIAVAVAVGSAIGIPASNRKNENRYVHP